MNKNDITKDLNEPTIYRDRKLKYYFYLVNASNMKVMNALPDSLPFLIK